MLQWAVANGFPLPYRFTKSFACRQHPAVKQWVEENASYYKYAPFTKHYVIRMSDFSDDCHKHDPSLRRLNSTSNRTTTITSTTTPPTVAPAIIAPLLDEWWCPPDEEDEGEEEEEEDDDDALMQADPDPVNSTDSVLPSLLCEEVYVQCEFGVSVTLTEVNVPVIPPVALTTVMLPEAVLLGRMISTTPFTVAVPFTRT